MSRLRFTSAQQVFDAFDTARQDITATPSEVAPLDYLKSLAQSATPEDAIAFAAYLLPRREAVWWACQCVRAIRGSEKPDEALSAAEAWVREPEEGARRAALDLGMAADPQAATTWLAYAAGWSGGSMAGPEYPTVAPPAHLTAKGVRAALLIGLARIKAHERNQWIEACIDAGIRFAEGGDARVKIARAS